MFVFKWKFHLLKTHQREPAMISLRQCPWLIERMNLDRLICLPTLAGLGGNRRFADADYEAQPQANSKG